MAYPDRLQPSARLDRIANGSSPAQTELYKFVAGINTNNVVTGGVSEHPIIEVLVRRSMGLHTALMYSARSIHAWDKPKWEAARAAVISSHEGGIRDLASITPSATALSNQLDGIVNRLMAEDEYFPHYENPRLAGMIHHSVVEQLRRSLRADPVRGES